MKKITSLILCLGLMLGLTACSSGSPVYVQSVRILANLGGIAPGDRFAGLVVSENVTEIEKDEEKTILDMNIKAGDDVKVGQELFSYDTEELQLTLDKQRLELEQLHASIESYNKQIKQLEKERKNVGATAKLQYTVQIQTTQVDLKEAEIKVKTKESEILKSEELLANATVVSPVDGRVQAISESGTDQQGNPLPFITIQQVGSYRIKGVINELQRGGIMEGSRLTIRSRTNNDTWAGTVTLVDYENPSQGSSSDMYFGMGNADEMSTSSRYPFYVQLDSTAGLILGQHVYMELETEEGTSTALSIGGAFICYEEADGSAYVWAEKGGKLEKRPVTLGEYNGMQDTYEILEGLTEEDYIAFPDMELCVEGAPTTHDQVVQETAPAGNEVA